MIRCIDVDMLTQHLIGDDIFNRQVATLPLIMSKISNMALGFSHHYWRSIVVCFLLVYSFTVAVAVVLVVPGLRHCVCKLLFLFCRHSNSYCRYNTRCCN
jgi:hypothetical protein